MRKFDGCTFWDKCELASFEWAIREAKDLFELDGLSDLKPTRATSQYQDGANEGEIRDREKVTRGLKTMDTSILKSMQTNHDYVRSHMALNDKRQQKPQ